MLIKRFIDLPKKLKDALKKTTVILFAVCIASFGAGLLMSCAHECSGDFVKIIQVSAGSRHSLALDEHGNLWGWGFNDSGQIGDGTIINRFSPIIINADGRMNNARIKYITSRAAHNFAIDEHGNLWAWGSNRRWWGSDLGNGHLGDNTTFDRHTPVRINYGGVINNARITSICAGYEHTLAIDEHGNLWAWGTNIDAGRLGDGTTYDRLKPVVINTDDRMNNAKATAVFAGSGHSLAIDEYGGLWAWGWNGGGGGMVGDGTDEIFRPLPVRVNYDSGMDNLKAVSISGSENHSLSLDEHGGVWAWGFNESGQIGDGSAYGNIGPARRTPVKVNNDTRMDNNRAVRIAAGRGRSFAIDEYGNLWAWGSVNFGALGNGISCSFGHFNAPVRINTMGRINDARVVYAAAGPSHSLAIDEFGGLWAWGLSFFGEQCDLGGNSSSIPIHITWCVC